MTPRAVLDDIEGIADEHPRKSADVLESLLRLELRYCAQAAAARGLDFDPGVQRRAVAAACLIGPDSESAAAGLLERLPDLPGPPSSLARWPAGCRISTPNWRQQATERRIGSALCTQTGWPST
jgi:hypothetical protein